MCTCEVFVVSFIYAIDHASPNDENGEETEIE